MVYSTRFAPSPTGPLHFGSLVSALGSFLRARQQKGQWHIRIDDLDTPRNVPGAAESILRDLEAFGLNWDGPVIYQSHRIPSYEDALSDLTRKRAVFACGCSRREIGPNLYPGTCRDGLPPGRVGRSLRCHTRNACVTFKDRFLGDYRQDIQQTVGDFVLKRADGIIGYHLATAVDDGDDNITEVLRGADLIDSTPRQIFLMGLLGLTPPQYGHFPVAKNARGQKLSKQTFAEPIAGNPKIPLLRRALAFLGQPSPQGDHVADLLQAATEHWAMDAVPQELLP